MTETNTQNPTSEQTAADGRGDKSTLLVVFVVVFIDLLGFGIVLPLLPRYGAHFRATGFQLGLLMAAFSAMQFLFAPMWGALSDRIGRRPVLMLGLLGSTLAYAMFGVATSLGRDGQLLGFGALTWLFVTRIGAGIAGATIATAQAVIADSTGKENRGKGMALIGAAFGIGFTFGPLIGAVCTDDSPTVAFTDAQYAAVKNWAATDTSLSTEEVVRRLKSAGQLRRKDERQLQEYLQQERTAKEVRSALLKPPSPLPGFVAALLSLSALVFAAIRLKETRPKDGAITTEKRSGILSLGVTFSHLTRGTFSLILIAIFITTFGFAQFESTLSRLTEKFGYNSRQNFYLFAYIGLVLSLAQGGLVRRLLPRLGEFRMAMTGIVLMVLGFVLLAFTANERLPDSALWWILPVITVGFSAVTPSLQSLLSQSASADEQGAVLGSGQSLSSLARILGPAIGLTLLDRSAAFPFFLAATMMLAGGLAISSLGKRLSQKS